MQFGLRHRLGSTYEELKLFFDLVHLAPEIGLGSTYEELKLDESRFVVVSTFVFRKYL